jgi:hypothetical protein
LLEGRTGPTCPSTGLMAATKPIWQAQQAYRESNVLSGQARALGSCPLIPEPRVEAGASQQLDRVLDDTDPDALKERYFHEKLERPAMEPGVAWPTGASLLVVSERRASSSQTSPLAP